MKKLLVLSLVFLSIMIFDSCKKEPKNQPANTDGKYTTTDVKVVLPNGSNIALSNTKIWTMTQTSSVNADGKAKVPFITGGCELVFLFDASDNIILMSYIYDGNKEISPRTTAQALLYHGLGLNILPDTTRQIFLSKNSGNSRLEDYYTKIEQAFKADVQMIEKHTFMTALNEAVTMITHIKPVDIYAKQLDIVDDEVRSQIQIEKIDDENVKINNFAYRRAHSFVYKTAFKDLSDKETILFQNIDYDDMADKNIKVEKVNFVKNAIDMYAQYYSTNPAITGPIALPIASNEKEATYKIRVIGPGKPGATLTNSEKAKLDELYYEYLAFNIMAPFIAEIIGVRSNYAINEGSLSSYLQKVKTIAALDPDIIQNLKDGKNYNFIPGKFFNAMDNAGQSRVGLINTFMDGFRTQFPNRTLPSSQQITNVEKQINKGLDLLNYLTATTSSKFVLAAHDYFNTMEEFTVKAKDNDVKVSPRKSDVMSLTNHPLNVEANPSLSNGQTIEYEWTTAGNFGVLKVGSTEGTTFTTTTKTINYYGKTTPNENNIEKVVVTVYVINSGGARTKYGSDTASINVKKIKIVMKPDGATLSPKTGTSSVKLYLENSDGTNPIVNNSSVEYRVNWNTAGSYGYLTGGVKSVITTTNFITYIASDDEVLEATENITAMVEFRVTQGSGWTPWMHRETVKGKVKINNEPKKKIYWVKLYEVHTDTFYADYGVCMGRGVADVKIEPDAIKYSVRIMGTFNNLWDQVHTWTPGNHPAWFVGYGHPRGIDGDHYTVAASVLRQANGPINGWTHQTPVPLMGMAEVTVWLK